MDEYYNKHYIRTDVQSRIIDYWSDGPHPNRDATDAICISDKGGYQFRLTPDGEENPSIYDMDGIPLYKWDGQAVQPRTEAELAADRAAIPPAPPSEIELLRQEVARLSAENAQMKQEQTDLQMAVCETYEMLLGGNDNG